MKILIYDGKLNSASFYAGLLQREGFEVEHAFTAHDAFVKLRSFQYPVIIAELDLSLNETLDNLVAFKEESPNSYIILTGPALSTNKTSKWNCVQHQTDNWIPDEPYGFKKILDYLKKIMPPQRDSIVYKQIA